MTDDETATLLAKATRINIDFNQAINYFIASKHNEGTANLKEVARRILDIAESYSTTS